MAQAIQPPSPRRDQVGHAINGLLKLRRGPPLHRHRSKHGQGFGVTVSFVLVPMTETISEVLHSHLLYNTRMCVMFASGARQTNPQLPGAASGETWPPLLASRPRSSTAALSASKRLRVSRAKIRPRT